MTHLKNPVYLLQGKNNLTNIYTPVTIYSMSIVDGKQWIVGVVVGVLTRLLISALKEALKSVTMCPAVSEGICPLQGEDAGMGRQFRMQGEERL